MLFVLALASLIALVAHFTITVPQNRFETELPGRIEATHARIVAGSQSEAATARANELLATAQRALRAHDDVRRSRAGNGRRDRARLIRLAGGSRIETRKTT